MHIRIRDGPGQQQQLFTLKDTDEDLSRLRLFKVASIFITFINHAKMGIPKEVANTFKWVFLLAIIGYSLDSLSNYFGLE